jgi:pimeloyl-ACP methyl ester carboxylesterase
MAASERWTTRSGPRIRYLDNEPAEPQGLPLLFSPGLSDTADEYAAMLDFFPLRRVFVVEVRGRGGSEAPPSGYSAADHVADLEAVLDEQKVERFHLMSFSRGTTWALDLALAHPDRVASLSIGDYRAVEVGLTPEFAESQWNGRFRGRPIRERLPRRVLEGIVEQSEAREMWDRLRDLPCPLLVVVPGGTGGILTESDVDRYRAARPDVEVVVVPEAGHDVFRPDRLFYPRAVASFVARSEVLLTG